MDQSGGNKIVKKISTSLVGQVIKMKAENHSVKKKKTKKLLTKAVSVAKLKLSLKKKSESSGSNPNATQ